MPQRSLNRDSDAAARRVYKRRKCDKLLLEVQRSKASAETSKAFIDYVMAQRDFDYLGDTLQSLDASLIPNGPLPLGSPGSAESIELKDTTMALQALQELGPFFEALIYTANHDIPPSAVLDTYATTCLENLVNCWPNIATWISYCLMHASLLPYHVGLVSVSTDILISLTTNPPGSRTTLNKEASAMSCTADVLFIILGQIDKTTGHYCKFIRTLNTNGCALMGLLRSQFNDRFGREALSERLIEVSRTTRRAILAMHLSVWKEFVRQDGIAKYTAALTTLSDTAHARNLQDIEFWIAMAGATQKLLFCVIVRTVNPVERLVEMFKGGLFRCMVRSLQCSMRPGQEFGCILPPPFLLPYLRVRRVFEVLYESGDIDAFTNRGWMPPDVDAMCKVFQGTIDDSIRVFVDRKEVPISMCSNLNHAITSRGAVEVPVDDMKTCRCRTVVYCSLACQTEDWAALHSVECRLSLLTQGQCTHWVPLKSTRNLFQIQRDQLAYIEYVLNHTPPTIPIQHGLRRRPDCEWHQATQCLLLDFSSPATTVPYVEDPGPYPELGPLLQKLDFMGSDNEWQPRIQRLIADRDREGEATTFLIEATFPMEEEGLIFTFAKARYVQDAPPLERIKVVNSVFRLGMKQFLP
ncbi:hypothetical protein DFP72DRAFT_867956 [Ephemerocybe angulata]|uniref:MYND-type domain-containing protein n=1 Tax=Ephemerocybe angulata TaxID=980116 RepID=A0A8H6IH93_9AGAR|nr:hypothetical protein DFP72DRAFT_867956 [Tulosesus angulatus]